MTNNATIRRAALVTGAANGIGRAIALGLLARGHAVVALDRDEDGLRRLVDGVPPASLTGLRTLVADVAHFDPQALAAEAIACFGRIDILVNNAAIGQRAVRDNYHLDPPKFYDVEPAQWQRALDVNATATFLLSREFVGPMMERNWGRIVNVTTSLGSMLKAGLSPYGPSKACAEALSAAMSADLLGTGVTVNVVVPGAVVDTPMIPAVSPFPRKQLARPDIMVPPVAWLCSDAGGRTTGRRFLAYLWGEDEPAHVAAARSGAPIGWQSLAALPIRPTVPA